MDELYKKPFRYDETIGSVFDANDMEVLKMRGWSFLLKRLQPNQALDVQQHMGHLITKLLNDKTRHGKAKPGEIDW